MRVMSGMRVMREMSGFSRGYSHITHFAHTSHIAHLIGDCAISYSTEAERREINKSADRERTGSAFKFSGSARNGPGSIDRSVGSFFCCVIVDIHCILPGIFNPVTISAHQLTTDLVGQEKGGDIYVAIIMM